MKPVWSYIQDQFPPLTEVFFLVTFLVTFPYQCSGKMLEDKIKSPVLFQAFPVVWSQLFEAQPHPLLFYPKFQSLSRPRSPPRFLYFLILQSLLCILQGVVHPGTHPPQTLWPEQHESCSLYLWAGGMIVLDFKRQMPQLQLASLIPMCLYPSL